MRSAFNPAGASHREDVLFALDGLFNVVLALCVFGLLAANYLIP